MKTMCMAGVALVDLLDLSSALFGAASDVSPSRLAFEPGGRLEHIQRINVDAPKIRCRFTASLKGAYVYGSMILGTALAKELLAEPNSKLGLLGLWQDVYVEITEQNDGFMLVGLSTNGIIASRWLERFAPGSALHDLLNKERLVQFAKPVGTQTGRFRGDVENQANVPKKESFQSPDEPAWMPTTHGVAIAPDKVELPGLTVADSYGADGGLAEYTLWSDGSVTLAHGESDTYLRWEARAEG